MPTRLSLRLAELLITATLAIAVLAAWRADRRDRAQLAAELAAAKQTLEQADARQHERDAQLVQTLASLAAEKRAASTPAEILRDLPQQLSLPSPIVLQPAPSPNAGGGPARPGDPAHKSNQPQAVIPAEDLKPLYDFALDCKACQSKLAAAQGDLADERAKSAVLTRERDAAIRAAKGGSVLRRINPSRQMASHRRRRRSPSRRSPPLILERGVNRPHGCPLMWSAADLPPLFGPISATHDVQCLDQRRTE